MTTETPASEGAARFLGPSGAARRTVSWGTRLVLWGFALMTARLALLDPFFTAPLAPSSTLDIEQVDTWYGLGGSLLAAAAVVAYLLIGAGTLHLAALGGARWVAALTVIALAPEVLQRCAGLLGYSMSFGADADAVLAGGLVLGLTASLLTARLAVAHLGRRTPPGPLAWSMLFFLTWLALLMWRRYASPDAETFALLSHLEAGAGTLGALMGAVFAARARRSVGRMQRGVPRGVEQPTREQPDWRLAAGWAQVTDGYRLIASGLLVRLLGAGLSVVSLLVARIGDVELVVRLLVLCAPVAAGLSAFVMLVGAHGLTAGPSPGGVRVGAWLAAAILLGTLPVFGLSYSLVISLFANRYMTIALTEELLVYDLIAPLMGYVALYALLSTAVRLAREFQLGGEARAARGFRHLLLLTVALTLAHGLVARLNLGLMPLLLVGAVTLFVASWLLVGSAGLLRRLANAIEEALAREGA